MANKIVQLTDKSGDNLFPVAGSMAGDSITTAMLQDGAVTAGKIDWSTVRYKAGDVLTIRQTMGGQVRNLSNVDQNDMGYFTVVLPFEVDNGVDVSLNTFEIEEIENIGFASTQATVQVLDSNNQSVDKTQAHMTAVATVDSSSRRTIILTFKLKTGYHWSGASSYNAVQFRSTKMVFTFSAASA